MPVQNKRGGASKSCTCKQCGGLFRTRKLQSFCTADCKHSFMTTLTNPPAILEGASNNESTIEPNIR